MRKHWTLQLLEHMTWLQQQLRWRAYVRSLSLSTQRRTRLRGHDQHGSSKFLVLAGATLLALVGAAVFATRFGLRTVARPDLPSAVATAPDLAGARSDIQLGAFIPLPHVSYASPVASVAAVDAPKPLSDTAQDAQDQDYGATSSGATPSLPLAPTSQSNRPTVEVDEANWKSGWKNTALYKWAGDSVSMTVQQLAVARHLSNKYLVPEKVMAALVKNAWKEGQSARVPPTLILAITAKESGFNPLARSPVGAEGLMQVLTRMHSDKFAKLGGPQAAFDPLANMKVGTRILKDYIQRTGSIGMALKHYVGAAVHGRDGGYAQKVHSEYSQLNAVAGLPTLELYSAYGKHDPFENLRDWADKAHDNPVATPDSAVEALRLFAPELQMGLQESATKQGGRIREVFNVGSSHRPSAQPASSMLPEISTPEPSLTPLGHSGEPVSVSLSEQPAASHYN